MAKVHITLVGGQAAPVFNAITVTNPDVVVFIYSNDSKKQMEMVRQMIDIEIDEQPSLDAVNPKEIQNRANLLYEKYKNDEITLNISSGLKSWSHLFGVFFSKKENCQIIYFDQNNILWNYSDMTHRSEFNFDMQTQLKLYGNSLENNCTNFKDYTDEDLVTLKKIEELRQGSAFSEFNELLVVLTKENSHLLKNNIKGHFETTLGSKVDWEKGANNENDIVEITLNIKGREKKERLVSPHAVSLAFNSGWFEYKIAHILSKWTYAKEIFLNCRFKSKKNVDKNEVDIIVNTGSKLLFVECKTQITHNTDIDKFLSVVKGYGGTASKGIFITQNRMRDIEIEKCDQANLLHFSLEEAENGLFKDFSYPLFLLLDSFISNINTK